MTVNDDNEPKTPLREMLESTGCALQDVTVLASLNDPFRYDTPSGHRDGKWLADMLDKLGIQRLHMRGDGSVSRLICPLPGGCRAGSAEPGAAADGRGVTGFPDVQAPQPPPLLSLLGRITNRHPLVAI